MTKNKKVVTKTSKPESKQAAVIPNKTVAEQKAEIKDTRTETMQTTNEIEKKETEKTVECQKTFIRTKPKTQTSMPMQRNETTEPVLEPIFVTTK